MATSSPTRWVCTRFTERYLKSQQDSMMPVRSWPCSISSRRSFRRKSIKWSSSSEGPPNLQTLCHHTYSLIWPVMGQLMAAPMTTLICRGRFQVLSLLPMSIWGRKTTQIPQSWWKGAPCGRPILQTRGARELGHCRIQPMAILLNTIRGEWRAMHSRGNLYSHWPQT